MDECLSYLRSGVLREMPCASALFNEITIKKLSNDLGDKAAFYYDEQLRMWRAENPAQMPWEKINAELHMEALQVGLKSRLDGQEKTSKQKSFQQQPFRGKSK